ncbi:electron transporter SenC [Bradyrhizobium sp. LTSPM299]|uniref:SCO family protein n=1 Tax=Bradyrhizobium sp. LTSPM299 TaxID=1619233 RepID=UPI0005CA6E26|nr:SCO family protein [Bradyrhizobium sp. LTSPM299]KJC57787.1 electron transporter SenC [Bradyrhizobium sp. LTSPM299]
MIVRSIALACAGLWLTLASVHAGDAPAQSTRSAAEIMDILMWNREPVGGPFALTDQTGHVRTNSDFRGRLMLVYFGFTYCPDVCPTDLQAIALALDKLGGDADSVQPIFITVDPERDTSAHLAEYVPLFHPRLIGLTGRAEAIRNVADAYKVYYAKVPLEGAGDYTVDHTAYIYLMDRDGNYLGFFPPGTSADRMVEIIKPRLAEPGH